MQPATFLHFPLVVAAVHVLASPVGGVVLLLLRKRGGVCAWVHSAVSVVCVAGAVIVDSRGTVCCVVGIVGELKRGIRQLMLTVLFEISFGALHVQVFF